ncbi:MAG: cellulose binding domain-containing protein [Catenulispora sp.]
MRAALRPPPGTRTYPESRTRRLLPSLIVAAALCLIGQLALAATATGTPTDTPTSSPISSSADCPRTTTVRIVSHTVSPTTVAPGGSAVETLTVLNCTDIALSSSVTFFGQWNVDGVPTAPAGCAAMDPVSVPLSFAPHGTVTTTFTLRIPATCTATSLTARAKVASTQVSSVEVAIVPSTSTPSCSATVQHHSWTGGFVTDVTVRNLGSTALNGWTVGLTYGGDNRVTGAWNAAVTQSGTTVTATNLSYNPALPAGGSIAFGAIGTWSAADAAPAAVTLGGHACQLT